MQHHENPICAQLGHYVGHMTVVYCPHHQGWTVIVRSGDDADDECDESRRIDFGPFDTTRDVAEGCASMLAELVNVRSRVWLERRRSSGF